MIVPFRAKVGPEPISVKSLPVTPFPIRGRGLKSMLGRAPFSAPRLETTQWDAPEGEQLVRAPTRPKIDHHPPSVCTRLAPTNLSSQGRRALPVPFPVFAFLLCCFKHSSPRTEVCGKTSGLRDRGSFRHPERVQFHMRGFSATHPSVLGRTTPMTIFPPSSRPFDAGFVQRAALRPRDPLVFNRRSCLSSPSLHILIAAAPRRRSRIGQGLPLIFPLGSRPARVQAAQSDERR